MNIKLIVVFACAIFLSQAAPVDRDLFEMLITNDRFFQYYKEIAHVTNGESNEGYVKFMLITIAAFKNWIVLLQDTTSEVYRLIVVAQHGNTVISTNQQILLNLFLESLYRHEIQFNQVTTEIIVIAKPTTVVQVKPRPVTTTIAPSKPINTIFIHEHKPSPSTANVVITPEDPALAKLQSENAHYAFRTVVDDNIKGAYRKHEEDRKDGAVHGMFEYDDGHIYRSEKYVADENGYRVLESETSPSKKTGQLSGEATVEIVSDNENTAYQINKDDIKNCAPGAKVNMI